ncbi:hypothetical protein BGZ65_012512 [Modicella reniformis]|uniref:HTH CENPB-type domain-containing protein n=1 Tax=Modicella reniformis TaxID=1440133 RepID=A0A9P6M7L3_9FUNG|nr:hypothetical protein BGZ65_012512 [Modicella reniformis]
MVGRQSFTLEEKNKFIEKVEETMNNGERSCVARVGRMFNMKAATARNMWKNRSQIQEAMKTKPASATKTISYLKKKNRKMIQVEVALFDWYQKQQALGCNVSNIRLQAQAHSLWIFMYERSKKGLPPFAFSDGWLNGFKRQHGLKMRTGHGESGSVILLDMLLEYNKSRHSF